jgi:hypothetical protein
MRHTRTGLDAQGVTSEQLRLQFYCSRTGEFFFPSLWDLLPGFLFNHPSSLPFFVFFFLFSFPLFSLPFIIPSLFPFLSFSLGLIKINIATQLILNYT